MTGQHEQKGNRQQSSDGFDNMRKYIGTMSRGRLESALWFYTTTIPMMIHKLIEEMGHEVFENGEFFIFGDFLKSIETKFPDAKEARNEVLRLHQYFSGLYGIDLDKPFNPNADEKTYGFFSDLESKDGAPVDAPADSSPLKNQEPSRPSNQPLSFGELFGFSPEKKPPIAKAIFVLSEKETKQALLAIVLASIYLLSGDDDWQPPEESQCCPRHMLEWAMIRLGEINPELRFCCITGINLIEATAIKEYLQKLLGPGGQS